jgi:hypothetical protein
MKREDLELYAMGEYDGDVAGLEEELARDEAARAAVADEARFELRLRDAAAAATFCAACDDLVRGARCDACGAAVRPGGYVVERVLVSNAHGRMYAARDADGKQVALKELAFVQSPSVEVIAAFEREVKFLRALEHPAIPRFCASFEEGAGVHVRYYLAQELVAGESLADRLESHWFSEAEIADIARQVLDVLVYLQGLSPMVIHRDIKPANLVVRADGTLAVVDFGAAHVQGMTVGSTAIGTFGYMPIEQLAGEVGPTTDLYALGASLLHLLTRKEPWRLLQGTVLADTDANLSRPMRRFLDKLVAPEPRQRFGSAAEARAALDRLGTGRRWRAARAATPAASSAVTHAAARAGSWLTRRVALSAIVTGALAVSGTVAVALLSDDQESRGSSSESDRAHAMRAANLARRLAQVAQLSAYRTLACSCTDRRCIDDVSARIATWSKDMAATGEADPLDPETLRQINALSRSMSACMTRVLTMAMPNVLGSDEAAEADALIAGDPTPGRTSVEVPLSGISIHDAARALSASCHVSVVVSDRVAATVWPREPLVGCERALDAVTRWSNLESRQFARWTSKDASPLHGGVFRIADAHTGTFEQALRDTRAARGIIDDPTPLPRADTISYKLHRVAVRSVLEELARDGRVDADIADSVDGRVTVFTSDAEWDVVLVAVLDAMGLSYRYDPLSKRLRIAPIEELSAGRPIGPPYGFLDIDGRALAGDTLKIDRKVTDVPPGRQVAVPAGKRMVEIRTRSDVTLTYTVDVAPASHTPVPAPADGQADRDPGRLHSDK